VSTGHFERVSTVERVDFSVTYRGVEPTANPNPVGDATKAAMLAPTPRDLLVDPQGRPYFLWDVDMTLEEFEGALRTADSTTRSYLVGKLMRQAKPDDVLQFVSPQQLLDLWPSVERFLGKTRPFWAWLLEQWEARGYIRR